MKLQTAVDRAIASENRDPQGLPADVLAGMEADILANPESYPVLAPILLKLKNEGR
jgi:hypothetical protein